MSESSYSALSSLMKESEKEKENGENSLSVDTDENDSVNDEYENSSVYNNKSTDSIYNQSGELPIGVNFNSLKRKNEDDEDERLKRSRERNRVHARNSRERKKNQMDVLQRRLQVLIDEKSRLMVAPTESSIASILISLSGKSDETASCDNDNNSEEASCASNTNSYSGIRLLPMQFSKEDLGENNALLMKDRSTCTAEELEIIRRERNRIHAKKTRLRKKRTVQQMELSISALEEEVMRLRQSHREKTNPPMTRPMQLPPYAIPAFIPLNNYGIQYMGERMFVNASAGVRGWG